MLDISAHGFRAQKRESWRRDETIGFKNWVIIPHFTHPMWVMAIGPNRDASSRGSGRYRDSSLPAMLEYARLGASPEAFGVAGVQGLSHVHGSAHRAWLIRRAHIDPKNAVERVYVLARRYSNDKESFGGVVRVRQVI